jgi:hypothetical protein
MINLQWCSTVMSTCISVVQQALWTKRVFENYATLPSLPFLTLLKSLIAVINFCVTFLRWLNHTLADECNVRKSVCLEYWLRVFAKWMRDWCHRSWHKSKTSLILKFVPFGDYAPLSLMQITPHACSMTPMQMEECRADRHKQSYSQKSSCLAFKNKDTVDFFKVHVQNCKKQILLCYVCMPIHMKQRCLSIHMKQLCPSTWNNSVCPSTWYNSPPNGQVFMNIDIFFIYVEKSQFSLKSNKNNGYFM